MKRALMVLLATLVVLALAGVASAERGGIWPVSAEPQERGGIWPVASPVEPQERGGIWP